VQADVTEDRTFAQGEPFMQLYEFQAKRVFQDYGIAIPQGRLARTTEEAGEVAKALGKPVAIKAQVLVGGRGLAGGVKFGQTPREVRDAASKILRMTIRGEKVRALLVEEKLEAVRELYAGVTWDYRSKCPVLVASSRGGVDIESVAREHPDNVARRNIDSFVGFSPYQGREIAARIGLKGDEVTQYAKVMQILWNIFKEHDAELVEVNPLAALEGGRLVAFDAKLNLDDKSIPRQSDLLGRIEQIPVDSSESVHYRRTRARELGIPTYIEMEGDMGIIADGAGSGMLTLDLVSDLGGSPKVYCEMGGEATPQLMENTMQAAMNVEGVKVVLINLIGGLNRMDEMAKGITSYVMKNPSKVPIVVRMSGTMDDEGRSILASSRIQSFDNLYDAAEKAVGLSGRNPAA
jgi:succinyl-CoA synthetase beta subunit